MCVNEMPAVKAWPSKDRDKRELRKTQHATDTVRRNTRQGDTDESDLEMYPVGPWDPLSCLEESGWSECGNIREGKSKFSFKITRRLAFSGISSIM